MKNTSFPSKTPDYQREYKANLRYRALMKLGGKCINCGYSDIRALCVDHIHGGGNKERKKIGAVGVWLKVLKGETDEYQCLCYNCNQIKKDENRE
jgi:hypothetical protein